MDCPRCGHRLTTITVAGGDGEATYCERCRFAGVTSEFEPTPESDETWEEAIDRFRESAVHRSEPVVAESSAADASDRADADEGRSPDADDEGDVEGDDVEGGDVGKGDSERNPESDEKSDEESGGESDQGSSEENSGG